MNVISLFSGCGGLDLGFERLDSISPLQMNLILLFLKLSR